MWIFPPKKANKCDIVLEMKLILGGSQHYHLKAYGN